MTRILAFLTSPHSAASVLAATACFIARTGPAETQLLHLRPETDPDFMPTEEIYTEAHRQRFEVRRDQLSAALSRIAENSPAKLPPLQARRGALAKLAVAAGAGADLAVIGSPHGDPDARTILEHLLFEARKPVLLVPPTAPHEIGRTVAVAWEERDEPAKHALEALDQLLLAATRAVILLIGDERAPQTPPSALLQKLQDAGKPAQIRHFALAGRPIGEALLAESHAAGADLLVMGAFGHSRLREFIFGGATVEVLNKLDLPVLMHH